MKDDEKSVVILLKGGRLPSWNNLSEDVQASHSQLHVELMLSVAEEHRMMRLEGYRLISPMDHWERFWVIEFPTLTGAEAWIQAEMAPPYGRYGYYEYHLARRVDPESYGPIPGKPRQISAGPEIDPHRIPELGVAKDVIVVLDFHQNEANTDDAPPTNHNFQQASQIRTETAQPDTMLAAESFALIAPQDDWDMARIVEFGEFADVETWLDHEHELSRVNNKGGKTYLSRKWAPEYFRHWAPLSAP